MENEKIGKLLLKFSIPAVIGMLVNAMYSVVDRIFVGRGVGSIALSGVAVTFPITNVIMAIGMLVGTGAAAVVSIKLGQKDKKAAEKIIGNAYTLTIILSIFISVIGMIFLTPILNLLGASPETMPYARQFATILLLGAVLQNVGFGLNPLMRSEGAPKMAMITMLIGAVLNFMINPLFVFVFHFGVRGSAFATVISQTVCSIWILYYFTKGKSLLKLKKQNMRLEKNIVKETMAIGMSPFAMQIAASIVTIVFNTTLEKHGGDLAIAAFSLINSITILILMPLLGINQGAQPIIGYNYGAKKISRVKKTLRNATIAATCISTLGFVIVQLFPVQIISIFNTTDSKLISIGSNGIVIYLRMFAVVGIQASFSNYFQSIGKAKHSMFLSLSRQIVLLVPLVLILPNFMGINGVWISGAIADFSSTVIAAILIGIEMKKLNKFEENNEMSRKVASF
ncbi:putative efflux protein, MATE family [Clostridium acidisoli DSM 12555]|uniref:Multidrug export protein MepA n=1 Tax=Clostridium acidisoli DSM 12555 TaxID=1121291 RepID=A0A1W1XI03_9CLOT|nr:putative efflux protein, MATE family [Clostridium acidisoli DSM 12555]